MRTREELDRMHDEVVERFPSGITPDQYRLVTLESADEDGKVYPHTIGDPFKQHSMLLKMSWQEGLLENRGKGYNAPFDWHITEKGREWLRNHNAAALHC